MKIIGLITPPRAERQFVHDVIYRELVAGQLRPASRARFLEIIRGMAHAGAEGVVLGCTEIPLLVGQEDTEVELFDTTRIHVEEAVEWALAAE